jgi:hypothetical protein
MARGTIALVCYGDKFSRDYVANVVHSIEYYHSAILANSSNAHTSYCWSIRILTDRNDLNDLGVIVDNKVSLPGWWNKMKLFDRDIDLPGERVIFLDLDTLITNKFEWLLSYNGPFMGIENLGINNAKYEDINQYIGVLQSGILAFSRERCFNVWNAFISDKDKIMKYFRGDGEFLHALCNGQAIIPHDLLQRLYPNRILSYKYQAYDGGIMGFNPEDASKPYTSFVLFHGEPSIKQAMSETVHPWGVPYEPREWVKKYWRA